MAMAADVGPMAPGMIYQEVKAWIAQQEAFEAQYNTPAPLTEIQRMALQALRLPTATPSPSPPPAAASTAAASADTSPGDNINYVGILMEYHQKCDHPNGLHWVEEASGTLSGGVIGRVCRVTMVKSLAHESGPIEHFPAVGYGLKDDGSEPRFKSKKAAKHFAAKCAVEWLAAQGLLPPQFLAQAVSPPPKAQTPLLAGPSLKRAAMSASSIATPPLKRQIETLSPEGIEGSSTNATTSPLSPQRANELVATLCHNLGFPAPRYSLVEIAPNTYDGKAQFEDYGDSELLSLVEASVVQCVTGKDATKKAIAAKLLENLLKIEEERDGQMQILLERLPEI